MNTTVEQLRSAKALIDTPEKLAILREVAKMPWFKTCIIHGNFDSAGMVSGFDRAIADAEQSEVQDA